MLLNQKTTLIVVSHNVKEQLLKKYSFLKEKNIIVLYNATSAPDVTGTENRILLKKSIFSLDTEDLVISFVGRLSPEKNLPLFFQALEPLLKSPIGNRLKLVIVGDGPVLVELKNLTQSLGIENKVIFLGSWSKMSMLYPLLDLIVIPSFNEGFSLVSLEALTYGIPVICSAGVSAKEIIADYVTLVKTYNVENFTQAIKDFIDQPELMRQRAAFGREAVLKHHLISHYVERLEALYKLKLDSINLL